MTIATQRWIQLLANAMTAMTLVVTVSSSPAHAHRKGIYASKAEIIGCTDVHQRNARWMPCADDRKLHQHMRSQ